jgi:hypothetical protein
MPSRRLLDTSRSSSMARATVWDAGASVRIFSLYFNIQNKIGLFPEFFIIIRNIKTINLETA